MQNDGCKWEHCPQAPHPVRLLTLAKIKLSCEGSVSIAHYSHWPHAIH